MLKVMEMNGKEGINGYASSYDYITVDLKSRIATLYHCYEPIDEEPKATFYVLVELSNEDIEKLYEYYTDIQDNPSKYSYGEYEKFIVDSRRSENSKYYYTFYGGKVDGNYRVFEPEDEEWLHGLFEKIRDSRDV